jgi:hypothetical protein
MFLSSILSLIAMSHDHNDHQKQLTHLITALKKNDISYAFAPADIAYRTDALSKDKIIMSPFDGNFFNAQRDNKVRSRVQAIISRTSSSDDQSMVLCIEGYFGAAYRRIEIPHYDIYLVNKDHQDKMFSIVKKCDLAARNSDR